METNAKVSIKDKEKIWNLYFERMYSFDNIIEYFKGKYNYSTIKSVINKKYAEYKD